MSSLTPTAVLHGVIAIASGGGKPVLENVTVKSGSTEQVITAGEGYDGIGEVTVEPIVLQNKTVTPSGSQQTVTADTGYDGLSEVTVDAVQSDGYDFVLYNGVSNIPDYFFRGQTQMKSFKFSRRNTDVSIGQQAFEDCNNMTRFEMPYCSQIKDSAFIGCTKMTDYYFGYGDPGKSSIPTLTDSNNIRGAIGCKIHVPADMEATYKAASNWSNLASIIVGDYVV